jgi:AcrR family transcriptional regulator
VTGKHEDKQKLLVDAAVDLFYEKGFQKTRISDIVGRAGVAQGTFYLYFKSKDDVFLHICREFTRLFIVVIEEDKELFAGPSYQVVHENVHGFIKKLITLFQANGKMARIVFFEGGSYGGKFRNVYESIYAEFIKTMTRRLNQSRRAGYISFEDAETEATFLVGLFDRSLFYFMDMKKHVDVAALSRRMADFVMGGLSKPEMKQA